MPFFPYTYRPHQAQAAAAAAAAVADGEHLLLEAPTGSGKTVALLAGVLQAAQARGSAVVYTTRTHSQQTQAIREFEAIRNATGLPLSAVALQGRHHLCLKLADLEEPEWHGATPEELSHFCRTAKRRTDEDPAHVHGCTWWRGLKGLQDAQLRPQLTEPARTAQEVLAAARTAGWCPYEGAKRALAWADLVVAPYIYVFEPSLRRRLLDWMQRGPDDVVLVVDEAHNLPEFLRRLFSPRMDRRRLRRARKEAQDLGDPDVLPGVAAAAFLQRLADVLEACVAQFVTEEDGFLPPFELEARLLESYTTTTPSLRSAARALGQLGEAVKDRKAQTGKVPRSALSGVGAFLEAWLDQEEGAAVKLAGRHPEAYLESFLVDTARTSEFLAEWGASVHASGTLAPLPEYAQALGFPSEPRLLVLPSPFPPEGLTVLATRGLTTRFESLKEDPRLVDRLQEATRGLSAAARVKTAVFFPSHDLLRQFREVGVFDDLAAPVHFEEQGLAQDALMERLARHRAAVGASLLVGVLGGRLSEGIDYPGRDLEALVLVGTPFPKPSAHQRALLQHVERRTGKGWDYTVTAPAVRRLRQAIGRLRRRAEDRGLVVCVDERSAPLLGTVGFPVELVEPKDAIRRMEAWRSDGLGT